MSNWIILFGAKHRSRNCVLVVRHIKNGNIGSEVQTLYVK